jgi:lipoprotein-anchoring transpeptidase ErfK/SrfK
MSFAGTTMLLKSLGVVGITVIAGMALVMPAKAERDLNAYSAVKTNFTVGAWSYKANPKYKRKEVEYSSSEKPGTIIIETSKRFLYLVLSDGKALRYGIGVGRSGFTWKGAERISRKAEWPEWHPPAEMIERQPDLPESMEGGPNNPLGARALYLGATEYRIHGTAQPWTIGQAVSSGCIRLTNEDVIDLYARTKIGAKVIVN